MNLLDRLTYASLDVLIVALLVWITCSVLRPRSARVRSLLWLLVPAKGLSALIIGAPIVVWGVSGSAPNATAEVAAAPTAELPLLQHLAPMPRTLTSTNSEIVAVGPLRTGTSSQESPANDHAAWVADAPATPASPPWSAADVALGVWGLGALLLLAISVRDRIRGARLVREAMPAEPELQAHVDRHAAAFGVTSPTVLRTTELESPALVGAIRPVVLIPNWMRSSDSMEWAIRHELMHVALRDPWAALVREVSRIALFFHPAVWLAGRRWEEAAELACDRALVQDADESLDYAEQLHALAGCIRRRRDPSLAHALFAARSRVGQRIEALVAHPVGRAYPTRRMSAVVLALFAATLSAGAGTTQPVQKSHDFELSGHVVASDGTPVAGGLVTASVYSQTDHRIVTLATARTGDTGSFALGYDKSDLPYSKHNSELWGEVILGAHAKGHGPDGVTQKNLESLEGITLRLVPDFPLRGRLVDEDGQPLAGAELRLLGVMASADESLDAWIASLATGGSMEMLNKYIHMPDEAVVRTRTDDTGAFVLRGVGRERMPWLQYVGGDAAYGHVRMVTRELDEEQTASVNGARMEPVHGSGSIIIANRTRPIEGVVVDAKTGKPVAGADVYSHTFGWMLDDKHILRTKTDAEGRFRIVGMAKGAANTLVVVPRGDEPYFMRDVPIPDPDGMAPVKVEVRLNKGIWITGKVIDAATGKPEHGRISYHPHLFNPLVDEIDQFKDMRLDGYPGRYRTESDGTFRIVGLPGPGLVGVEVDGPYLMGVGFDPGEKQDERGYPPYVSHGMKEPSPEWPNTMKIFDLPPEGETLDVELRLEAGRTLTLAVADSDGKPVAGIEAKRTAWINLGVTVTDSGECVVQNLGPDVPRVIRVHTTDSSLGAVTRLDSKSDDHPALILSKPVTIKGRLIDEDGVPLAERQVSLYVMPEEFPANQWAKTDLEGNFTMEGVFAGTDYSLLVGGGGFLTRVSEKLQVESGGVIDLGVKVIESR